MEKIRRTKRQIGWDGQIQAAALKFSALGKPRGQMEQMDEWLRHL